MTTPATTSSLAQALTARPSTPRARGTSRCTRTRTSTRAISPALSPCISSCTWVPTGRFAARKPWVPTTWTVASMSSLPPCGQVWA